MSLFQLPILPVLIPLCVAVLMPFVGWRRPGAAYALAYVGTAATAVAAFLGLGVALRDGALTYTLGGWPPPLGIEYVLDPLSGFTAALITLAGFLVLEYSKRRVVETFSSNPAVFYSLFLLLLAGLLGMVMTGDLFNFYVFLEISSLAAYALIASGGPRGAFGAFRYLLLGTIAGSLYLMGVGHLYFLTGTLNMADMVILLPDVSHLFAAKLGLVLIVTGLCFKMALLPLHLWLPDAYAYAPSPVAAFISSTMSKAAAYALIRVLFGIFGAGNAGEWDVILQTLMVLGAAAIIAGSLMAIRQTEFKRMLAYSSVSQVGYIAVGIGIASPLALAAALYHFMAHAMTKSLLFLVADAAAEKHDAKKGDTVSIESLSGLAKRNPQAAFCLAIGALSMVGVPPLAGFFSKWYLVLAGIENEYWIMIAAILLSTLLNAVYFFRILEKVYCAASPGAVRTTTTSGTTASAIQKSFSPALVGLACIVIAGGVMNAWIVTEILLPCAQTVM